MLASVRHGGQACRRRNSERPPGESLSLRFASQRNPISQENSCKRELVRTIASPIFALAVMLSAACAQAQDAKAPYPSMAPVDQYLIADRNSEIALARSAAPDSISADADVLVLASHGYETAAKGKNGFVCMVLRSWTAGIDDPDFWNPHLRAPICFNPPAVRSYLPYSPYTHCVSQSQLGGETDNFPITRQSPVISALPGFAAPGSR